MEVMPLSNSIKLRESVSKSTPKERNSKFLGSRSPSSMTFVPDPEASLHILVARVHCFSCPIAALNEFRVY
jgi:hypothetical protein